MTFLRRGYEECRRLGYKNPVLTSEETHYLSTTYPIWLILCNIWGFHGGVYGEFRLLGCDAMWALLEPTFQLLLIIDDIPRSRILSILKTEGTSFSESSVLTRLDGAQSPKAGFFWLIFSWQ
jgi:hypothetical protein